MFRKRAQAAMEFLMTYGWAILVVLVAIGALAYFGVLSPDKFLPERCQGPSGLDCLDKASILVTSQQISFVLKNNLGNTINTLGISGISGTCTGLTGVSGAGTDPAALLTYMTTEQAGGTMSPTANYIALNGRKILVHIHCTTPSTLDTGRFKGDIGITYTNADTNLVHNAIVSVTGVAS